MRKKMHCNSSLQYLKGVKSKFDRSRVQKALRRRFLEAGESNPTRTSSLNQRRRIMLQEEIFKVEDEIESKAGGQPEHPRVVDLRRARNLVLDDLGWNEYPE